MSEEVAGASPADEAAPPIDPHLLVTRAGLDVLGVQALLWAQAMPVTGAFGALTDPDLSGLPSPEWIGAAMGTVAGLFVLVPGAACLFAAAMLGRRTRRAWLAGVVTSALLLSACWPMGAYGLFALLRPEARRAYGADP